MVFSNCDQRNTEKSQPEPQNGEPEVLSHPMLPVSIDTDQKRVNSDCSENDRESQFCKLSHVSWLASGKILARPGFLA